MKASEIHSGFTLKVLTVILTGLLIPQGMTAQAWFDPGWDYRVSVTITNGGSALTEYQVKLSLDGAFPWSHAKSDGSDIRFTTSDGITDIPYWIESWTPSTSATIWAKVPSVGVGTTTVYIYYGNPSATTTANGTNTFEFFDDFSYTQTISVDNEAAIAKAINWIKVGQDFVNNDAGGVPFWYNYPSGPWYSSDYPEVTGYIIPTIFDRYHVTNDADLLNRAITMADWELTIEGGDGTWGFVYDNGMVMQGLLRAYEEILAADPTKAATYLASLTRAAAWLLAGQDANGSWVTGSYGGFAHSYHSRIDWVLLRLWQITGNITYKNMAIANLNWVLDQEVSTSGWFNNNGIGSTGENPTPFTHAIAYCAEGLLESGFILSATDPTIGNNCINAARRTADALLPQQSANGSLTGANYNSSWVATTSFECLTGSAQMSVVWSKLYHHTGNLVYRDAARAMNRYLTSVQGNSADTGIDGGIAGSDPINGSYQSNTILSWATKFFIDALYLEKLYGGNYTIQFSGFDPAKWTFPYGGSYFSIDNGMLFYNGPTADFGPRMRALKDGSDYVFTNGIIEYRNMSNGGYDQLGIMYRTTVPEDDDNGYMYFPSTWNSIYTWYASERNGGVTQSYPTGGIFERETWYDVRAVINGSDHNFFANGSPTVSRPDNTYSSGAIGLLAWGDAVSWVDDFRVRQYAANEPVIGLSTEEFQGIRWTGDLSSDWGADGNWSSGVPGPTENVVILSATHAPMITGTVECNNITIDATAVLALDPGGALTVNGNLTNNGMLTIGSTLTTSGSLIVNGTSTGIITYNRQLKPGSDATRDWHLVSAPVENNTAANAGKISTVNEWSETTGAWNTTSITSSLPGHGYNIRQTGASDGLITFTGTLLEEDVLFEASSPYADAVGTGDDYYTRAIAAGRSLENPGGKGWNLLGNPYASAILASEFINANFSDTPSLSQFDPNYVALFLFDGTDRRHYYIGNPTGWSGGGGLSATHVQAGQGFFVLAMNDNSEFLFSRAMQEHSTGTAMLKSAGADERWPGLQLKVKYGSSESITTVVYNEKMTSGLDPGYDIGLFSSGQDIEVYTTLALKDNSVNFARQALPVSGADTIIIPVGIDSEKGGEVTFSAKAEQLRNYKFWLEDRTMSIFTDLNTNTYTVIIPAKTYGTGRFFVIASTNTPTGIGQPEAEDTDLRVWTSDDKVIIKGEVSNKAVCDVYDLNGQKILEIKLADSELNTANIPSGFKGVLVVRIIDGVKVTTKKVALL